ncbi:hypothetical protein EZS27_005358 [termite gut metagenome]|uniref:Bro-N domain-containing protein n=1 Tax=termite gut metagenome TaxID=433724 RepID=A0A5J4SM01_9ZZZZ
MESLMNTKIRIFQSSEFGEIRTAIGDNGESLFCLVDLCNALGIKNTTQVAQRLDDDERPMLNIGRENQYVGNTLTTFVTESGMYAVILRSNKPEARRFRKWVTSEVLPSIRRNGGYHLFEPIGGVLPIFYDGKVGYPRKELLMAAGYSSDSGTVNALKKKLPEHFFTLFRTACVSAEFAKLRYNQGKVRQLEIQFYANAKKAIDYKVK